MAKASAVPRLASDLHRNTLALAVGAGGTLFAFFVYAVFVPVRFSLDTVAATAFVFWTLYAVSTAVLTHLVFRRVDGETLRRWLLATNPSRRSQQVEAAFAGVGIGPNVSWSVLALLSVALIVAVPGLLDSALANALGFGVVVSSWAVTVYAYAIHYGRLNSRTHSLDYPGDTPAPVFDDYLYLSAQIATTFSSSDVSVLTTPARRVVTGQTLIAFVFTSFIIAMIIGLLFI